MVVPQSKPLRAGKILSAFDRDFSAEAGSSPRSGSGAGNLDESTALSSLKELIATGDHRLDPILANIAHTARQVTGASGAALAMWKEGAMVCRSRSGETAPALGARLSADTGISGECLRTGKMQHCTDTENDPLVDVEVCRSLGLRSIAVLPIQGWRGINGILEVFSTRPAAFSETHIAMLQQLAALAERARAAQPHGASPAAPRSLSATEKPQSSGLLPASDRVGDLALAFVNRRSRPFVLGGIGVAAVALLALVIWLGWRGPAEADRRAHAAAPAAINAATTIAASTSALTVRSADAHPLDNDRVWKANPGGETLYASNGKPSAGSPVVFAAKVDVIAGKKNSGAQSPAGRSSLLADLENKVAANVVTSYEVSGTQLNPEPAEAAPVEAPSIPVGVANQTALNGVLSAKASLPGFSATVSQGVSGGELVRRVPPVYPAQARVQRLEGSVILSATVLEDGTVTDVKVVEGLPMFSQPAVDAVKRWRYKPYELDGKPVKNSVKINVDFKFPRN